MFKFLLAILTLCIACFLCVAVVHAADGGPASAPAAKVPAGDDDAKAGDVEAKPAAEQISTIVKLFKDKEWKAAIAAVLMFLVFLWRKLDPFIGAKIPPKHLPWVVALVGFLASIPGALMAKPWSWGTFIVDGLLISGTAVLFWSTLGKKLLGKWLPDKT